MEACQRMEFTSVELAGGEELAAPVEKATTGPVEKAMAGLALEKGGTVEREEDGPSCSGVEEMPADGAEALWRGRRGEEESAVESTVVKAARRSAVAESCRGATVR
jgi:hypothetical protein